MRRIVVVGGRGWFGGAAAEMLRRAGGVPVIASRRPGADVLIDAEDSRSLAAGLHEGDVVIDAAGPFHGRSSALVVACLARRCDVIDRRTASTTPADFNCLGRRSRQPGSES